MAAPWLTDQRQHQRISLLLMITGSTATIRIGPLTLFACRALDILLRILTTLPPAINTKGRIYPRSLPLHTMRITPPLLIRARLYRPAMVWTCIRVSLRSFQRRSPTVVCLSLLVFIQD
jgi:hypothetical protein